MQNKYYPKTNKNIFKSFFSIYKNDKETLPKS